MHAAVTVPTHSCMYAGTYEHEHTHVHTGAHQRSDVQGQSHQNAQLPVLLAPRRHTNVTTHHPYAQGAPQKAHNLGTQRTGSIRRPYNERHHKGNTVSNTTQGAHGTCAPHYHDPRRTANLVCHAAARCTWPRAACIRAPIRYQNLRTPDTTVLRSSSTHTQPSSTTTELRNAARKAGGTSHLPRRSRFLS